MGFDTWSVKSLFLLFIILLKHPPYPEEKSAKPYPIATPLEHTSHLGYRGGQILQCRVCNSLLSDNFVNQCHDIQ